MVRAEFTLVEEERVLVELGNKLVNLDQVLWIEHEGKDREASETALVRFANGETLRVRGDLDWISKKINKIFTAPPGLKLVRGWYNPGEAEDKRYFYETIPIVAFNYRGEQDIIIDPITLEGVPEKENWAIVDLDGRCWDINQSYDSVEAFKKQFEEEHNRRDTTKQESPA